MGKGRGTCSSKSDDALPDTPTITTTAAPLIDSNTSVRITVDPPKCRNPSITGNNGNHVSPSSPSVSKSNTANVENVNLSSYNSSSSVSPSLATTPASTTTLKNNAEITNTDTNPNSRPHVPALATLAIADAQSRSQSPMQSLRTSPSPSHTLQHFTSSETRGDDTSRVSGRSFDDRSTAVNVNHSTIASYLVNVPLLSKLTEEERNQFAQLLSENSFSKNDTIVREGDDGDAFYIIKEGHAKVTKLNEQGDQIKVCTLRPSDYFGEQSLVNNSKRMATVTAVDDVVNVFVLTRDKFNALFRPDRLNITFAKRAGVSAEPAVSAAAAPTQIRGSSSVPPERRTKTSAQEEMLSRAVKTSILFSSLNDRQRESVVELFWLKEVPAQTALITQGDLGNHFYVIESGHFDIFVKKPSVNQGTSSSSSGPSLQPHRSNGSANHTNDASDSNQNHSHDIGTKVTSMGPTQSFGELALLYNAPRAATAISAEDSVVWVLSRSDFRQLLETSSSERLKEYEKFFREVSSFNVLLDYERIRVAEALEEITFPKGHCIFKQGDDGDTFFIIKSGEVVVSKREGDVDAEVAHYTSGDYFGELAIVKNERRAATVTAITEVTCLYMNREAFSLLLGPMEDIFKRRRDDYARANTFTSRSQSDTARNASSSNRTSLSVSVGQVSTTVDHRQRDILFEELIPLGVLGKGSFGAVQLVRHRVSNKTFALKTLYKQVVVAMGQQEHVQNEKSAMMRFSHPFLVNLLNTYQDNNSVYLLLDVSLGGELFSLLRGRTYFDESTTRFYAAAVVCMFEYIHATGYIYRDLKPENLLLDSNGYLKLTDFGFAKYIGDGRTFTLCGTPDYLAPEVVSGKGHSKAVDWWTLGILMYEMLAGYPPFYDEDPMKTYAKIIAGRVVFPSHISRISCDLIKQLLHPKPTKRLGAIAGGANAVKAHPFFRGFDWDGFVKCELKAPIIPKVKNDSDMSNFDKYPPMSPMPPIYKGCAKFPNWDADF